MKKVVIPYSLKDVLQAEGSILQRNDIVLFTAGSPDKVLSLHRSERLDLIVLDIRTARMNPESFVSGIRRDPQLRKVSIVLVGKDTEANRILSARGGANAFFTPDTDPQSMLRKLGQLLSIPERKSYRALLRVTVKASWNEEHFLALSRNISIHGILIETARILRIGNGLGLSFQLPPRVEIVAEGVVVREAPAEENGRIYGVEFARLHEQDLLAIQGYVDSHFLKSLT